VQEWEEVWRNRLSVARLGEAQYYSLSDLIALAGYDHGPAAATELEFRRAIRKLEELLELVDGESLLELGCGPGALLKALNRDAKLTGIDFSAPLLDVARTVLPQGSFINWNLNHDEGRFPKPLLEKSYDVVIAHGVVHYLSVEAGEEVIRESLRIADRAVFIGDIPNSDHKDLTESLREASYPPGEYRKKYQGYRHTYFDPHALGRIPSEPEFRAKWSYTFLPSSLFQTNQSQLRFSALYFKQPL
jgi:cyclopropane fatty-acyl-phospholipid synthase-like methyltransferase